MSSIWAAMWEAVRSAGSVSQSANLHSLPFFAFSGAVKGLSKILSRRYAMSIKSSSASTVVPFYFKSKKQIRTVLRNGEPWFVAVDICKILNLGNTSDVLYRIPKKHVHLGSIEGADKRERKVNLISESGMYRLVLRSDKPEAEPFIEWVTSEVLPAIRKTGSYIQPDFEYEFSRKRFIVSFRNDNKAFLEEVPDGHFLISRKELPRWLADPGNYMSKEEEQSFLHEIALAALARLTLHPSEAWNMLYGRGKGILAEKSI